MANASLSTEQILTLLAATPTRLATATGDLTPTQSRTAPASGEWSANEVLAHLRACADTRGGCIVAMLTEGKTTLRAINPLTWIKQTNYLDLDFEPSFRAFATQRAELLALLRALPPEGWSRSATVTGAGAPIVRTVLTYAQWVARHERPHVKQIERIANALRG
ncbi:MAG: DinB family protein [Ktedonobacterales bacterium]